MESMAQHQGGSPGQGGSCSAGGDIRRMSLPGDCDIGEGRGFVVPHRSPGLIVQLAVGGEVLVLVPAVFFSWGTLRATGR